MPVRGPCDYALAKTDPDPFLPREVNCGIAMHRRSPRSTAVPTLPPRGKSVEIFPPNRGGRSLPRHHTSAAKKTSSCRMTNLATVLPSVRRNEIA